LLSRKRKSKSFSTTTRRFSKTALYLYEHNQEFLIERINACKNAKHPQALLDAAEKNSNEIENLEIPETSAHCSQP